MTRIVTPSSKDGERNDPARVTEISIYKTDHKLDFAREHLPSSFIFDGVIPVEFRAMAYTVTVVSVFPGLRADRVQPEAWTTPSCRLF